VRRGDWRGLDESDVRQRPNPRGSRPRTKQRPEHAAAIPARVVRADRGRYTTMPETAAGLIAPGTRPVTAMKARELGRASIVVGDVVYLVGDVSGVTGTLARIVRVAQRTGVLRRSPDDSDPAERVIVAGADQLVVVTALADPPPRPRLIDRCLVAAYDAGMDAVLCLTKSDLPEAHGGALEALYVPLGVRVVATGLPFESAGVDRVNATGGSSEAAGAVASGDAGLELAGVDDVRALLARRVSVLVGHSGVGKSTLVNALVPGASRVTADVNEVTGRGRHTSTNVIALPLPGGGWVIDTPGIRSFGLGHVRPERVLAAFEDLALAAEGCPRGCTHLAHTADCALDGWAGANANRWARLDSFRRLWAGRQ
jgi:ribosome biogenesis GTPase